MAHKHWPKEMHAQEFAVKKGVMNYKSGQSGM